VKDCNQCGKCCIKYSNGGLSASEDEIAYWETFKPHIAHYINDGKIWMDPKTGEQIERCPWLRLEPKTNLYTCDIYYDRPDDCKFYPTTIAEMIIDECEMLDKQDIAHPKQAQKKLDRLMADSRPPLEN
jgi:Fe-S-cluster containining protein